MNKIKKILTLDDLVMFCKTEKFYNFSAKDTGYQLAVQMPSTFEISDDHTDNTLLFCNVKLFHIGENRNHSSVTKDAAVKALSTIAYKPLLANFCEIDGVKDFTAHDMVIDEDGNLQYIERQIGCFTSDIPTIKYDEDADKEFVCARVAIPRDYTDACDIIERKNGTKVSVELLINEMQYSVDKQLLELTDIVVSGATCLGKNPETGEDVQEGMEGARLDIADFSNTNNSVFSMFSANTDYQAKMIEVLDKLNTTLSNFNKNSDKKGGNEMDKLNELLAKYGKTASDIAFETEGLSDEELEAKFAEVFGEPEDNEPIATEEEACGKKRKKCSNEDELFVLKYELSHDDIRAALYQLLDEYSKNGYCNCWIAEVYDNKFIYQDYSDGKYYRRGYTKDGDNVSLMDNRTEVFNEWLSKEEKDALDTLKADYAELKSFKENYEAAQAKAQKDEVFAKKSYEKLAGVEAFEELKKNAANFSLDEVINKAKIIYADFMEKAEVPEEGSKKDPRVIGVSFNQKEKTKKAYGNLFNQ